MNRLGMVLVLVMTASAAVAKPKMTWFDLRKHSVQLFYNQEGRTCLEIKRYTSAVYVISGGYSGYAVPKRHQLYGCRRCRTQRCRFVSLTGVDLVWRKGRTFVEYLGKKRRPVLVISRIRRARIDWPRKGRWKARRGDLWALAGDYSWKMPDPQRVCWRQFVGLRGGGYLVGFGRVWGTPARVRKMARGDGVKERSMMALDGGSQAPPSVPNSTHVVVMKF